MKRYRIAGPFSGSLWAALIISPLTGCDNVTWGGAHVRLEPPPSKDPEAAVAEGSQEGEDGEIVALPDGEILFVAEVTGDTTFLFPVAFVSRNGAAAVPGLGDPMLGPMMMPRLENVSEVVLASEGVRAGTAVVVGAVDEDPMCPLLPRLRAMAELRSGFDPTGQSLLGIPRDVSPLPAGSLEPPVQTRDVRASTLTMAGAQITEVGAVWPPSILGIRQDIRIFRTPRPGPGVAATFMYRGQLDTSPAQAGSYSIFVMGEQVGEEVVPTYADFRRGSTDGKWAPRFLGQLDWDADGSDEVALELYGDGIRGFRLLERTSEGFVTSLEVACGPTAVGSAEAGAP